MSSSLASLVRKAGLAGAEAAPRTWTPADIPRDGIVKCQTVIVDANLSVHDNNGFAHRCVLAPDHRGKHACRHQIPGALDEYGRRT